MIEPNMKLLEAMRDEANLCYERGDEDDGNALVESIFAQIFPGLVEAAFAIRITGKRRFVWKR